MRKEYRVGIIGGTGMVGQRFVTLMEGHPWFRLTAIAASGRSAGKRTSHRLIDAAIDTGQEPGGFIQTVLGDVYRQTGVPSMATVCAGNITHSSIASNSTRNIPSSQTEDTT